MNVPLGQPDREEDEVSHRARTEAVPYAGRTFYAPLRDAVAYLLSGLAWAALVAFVSMLAAWMAAEGAG